MRNNNGNQSCIGKITTQRKASQFGTVFIITLQAVVSSSIVFTSDSAISTQKLKLAMIHNFIGSSVIMTMGKPCQNLLIVLENQLNSDARVSKLGNVA